MSMPIGGARIEELVRPYLVGASNVPVSLYDQLHRYLELLVKWNARTNLTAIREPEEMVQRHFGESLFAASHLEAFCPSCETLLDFGSGAGLPGIPIQLLWPTIKVTLAESQNKKATFLREVVRTLGLKTEVWAARVESMPLGRSFDVVAMRAVDDMQVALEAAAHRAKIHLLLLTTVKGAWTVPEGFEVERTIAIAESISQQMVVLRRLGA